MLGSSGYPEIRRLAIGMYVVTILAVSGLVHVLPAIVSTLHVIGSASWVDNNHVVITAITQLLTTLPHMIGG